MIKNEGSYADFKIIVQNTKMSGKNSKKNLKCFLTYIEINANGKWVHPSESWGPEDFKTGIAFENWWNMKPIPSKTRKVEKSQFQLSVSAKG